jgi:hypothetical protein
MNHHRSVGRATRSLTRLTATVLAITTALILLPRDAVAACATNASVMTCTLTTTTDTVDTTGLPANAASLRDAIIQVNSVAPPPSGQTHIINLPANFVGTSFKVTLFKFLPPIWNDVTINGNGNTIEGNNVAITGTGFDTRLFIVGSNGDATGQPYFAPGARVKFVLNDLTLKNGVARGGRGGGGGMGAGGAIFVTANGDVTARSVKFISNWAVGGDGDAGRAGGGMGGNGGLSLRGAGGGWGGDGNAGGGGIAGSGGGTQSSGVPSTNAGGGGGLSHHVIGNVTTLRGLAIAAAGGGYGLGSTTSGATTAGGSVGGGGGGGGDNNAGISGNSTGVGGASMAAGMQILQVRGAGGGGAGGASAAIADQSTGSVRGGTGGFGGGGGGAVDMAYFTSTNSFWGQGYGGNGGFGGGAGGTSNSFTGNTAGFGGGGSALNTAGAGGFGGGDPKTPGFGGGNTDLSNTAFGGGAGSVAGAGGGAGFGGAVFLHKGGTFTVQGDSAITGGLAVAGVGAGTGSSGKACATGVFVHGGQYVTVSPDVGETVVIQDEMADSDCAGTISPSGNGGLLKSGNGTLELRGAHAVSRELRSVGGTLRLLGNDNGAVPPLNVFGGARLEMDGSANVTSYVVVTGSATLFPGLTSAGGLFSAARVRVPRLSLASLVTGSGTLEVLLGGVNAGADFSQIVVTGTGATTLSGSGRFASLSVKLRPAYTPTLGDSFAIIDYDQSILQGTFAGLAENATFTVSGVTFRINYASGGPFVRLTVTAAPTLTPTVQLQSANGSIATGQSVALSATVNGSSGAATGTVLFRDTSGNVISGCAAKPLVAGVATCNTTFSTVGTYTLLADYSGDVNYRAETSSTITQNVVAPTVPSEPGWTTFGVSAPEGIGILTFTAVAPVSDGGSPIISYTLRCVRIDTSAVISLTQTSTSFTLSPLALAVEYRCSLLATNAIGDGPFGQPFTARVFASLNVDNSTAAVYDAETDGVMILRYMLGVRGDAISAGVIGATATRDAAQIAAYLDNIKSQLDIDGDGFVNAATDGLLIMRHMRGVATVTSAYILHAFNPAGSRNNEDDITTYLSQMMP